MTFESLACKGTACRRPPPCTQGEGGGPFRGDGGRRGGGPGCAPARRLCEGGAAGIVPMDWSPDGKWIAVRVRREDRTAQIGLVAVKDGSLRVLKSIDWRGPSKIAFSPDSLDIAFDLPVSDASEKRDIFVLAADGSREVPAVVHAS